MARTVQSLMLEFALLVDPRMKDETVFSLSTIGVNDGDKFTKQELLDYYNKARFALFQACSQVYGETELSSKLSNLIKNSVITFTLSGVEATASKPSDYVKALSVDDSSNSTQVLILPMYYLSIVRSKTNQDFVQTTTTNRFLFEKETVFLGINDPAGAFPNGKQLNLNYYALSNYTLSDVTGGTVKEAYPDILHPILIELAVAVSNEQGYSEVLNLAKLLVRSK